VADSKKYYNFLDGCRGIAILWIFFGHAIYFYDLNIIGYKKYFVNLPGLAYLAVDIFFIISGFLMTGMLLEEGKTDIKKFLRNRAVRILPQYLVLVIIIVILSQMIPPFSIKSKVIDEEQIYKVIRKDGNIATLQNVSNSMVTEIEDSMDVKVGDILKKEQFILRPSYRVGSSPVQYFLLVPNYFLDRVIFILGHTWFVGVIIHFYFFFAVLIFINNRITNDPKTKRIFLLCLMLGLIIIVNILRYSLGVKFIEYYKMTHFRMDAILFGCLLKLGERFYIEAKGVFWNCIFPVCCFLFGFLVVAVSVFTGPYPELKVPYSFSYVFTLSYVAFGCLIAGSYKTRN